VSSAAPCKLAAVKLHSASASATLSPVAPFDFGKGAAFLEGFSPTSGEQVIGANAITKAIRIGRQTMVFRVEGRGTVDRPRLAVTMFSAKAISGATRAEVEQRLAQFLSIEDDLAPFYALAAGDRVLTEMIERARGLHQVRFLTLADIAIWAVLSQRSPRALARKAKRNLVERYAEPLEVDGHTHWPFPSLEDLGDANPAQLQKLIGNERRARYAHAVISALRGTDETFLHTAPYAEVEAWLKDIDGIGDWSSAFILFRGLGRCERLPAMEMFLEMAREAYGPKFSEQHLDRAVAKFGKWSGYWALYLWARRMGI
jgi:DNA-3-methyladenine glycosylase II